MAEAQSYKLNVDDRRIYERCTDQDIVNAEVELGMPFPTDYRRFLTEHNGVKFGSFVELAFEEDAPARLSVLYGVGRKFDIDHVLGNRYGYDFCLRVPSRIIAIGKGHSFPRLCISMSDDDMGAIYWWDPGVPWEEQENEQTDRYLTRLSDSFADFWHLIR